MPHWKDYPSAPNSGEFIGNMSDLPDGATTLELNTENKNGVNGKFPLIVVRHDNNIYAYVNVCPHQYLPLDYRSKNILSSDGKYLMCSAHGAKFDCKTGKINTDKMNNDDTLDCYLDRVPISVSEDGKFTIAAD